MPTSLFEVYNLLPKTNCKKCGTVCMGFAAKVISREVKPEDCPLLLQPEYAENLEKLKELFPPAEKELTGLIIDEEKCTGCGICVVACEENRTNEEIAYGKGARWNEEVVLRVDNGKIKLVEAMRCKRAFKQPIYCRTCVEHCPTGAIELL